MNEQTWQMDSLTTWCLLRYVWVVKSKNVKQLPVNRFPFSKPEMVFKFNWPVYDWPHSTRVQCPLLQQQCTLNSFSVFTLFTVLPVDIKRTVIWYHDGRKRQRAVHKREERKLPADMQTSVLKLLTRLLVRRPTLCLWRHKIETGY